MMRACIKIFLVIALCSCSKNQIHFGVSDTRSVCTVRVPDGYKKSVSADDHGNKMQSYLYKDGSIIYITDDGIGKVSQEKSMEYGKDIYDTVMLTDSIDLKGSNDNKYWREVKRNKIILGYENVDSADRGKYDEIFHTWKFKTKNRYK